MAITYNYLKNALRQKAGPHNLQGLFLFLILATIPLAHIYNSVAVIAYVLWTIICFKKNRFIANPYLILPVLLFVLMAVSAFWSIDKPKTLESLVKVLPLLLLPLAFMANTTLNKLAVLQILKRFSIVTVIYGVVYCIRALYRYSDTGNAEVFFYHEFAGDNAIYTASIFSIALFYYVSGIQKKIADYLATVFLSICIILLSSKTVIIIDLLLVIMYYLFYAKEIGKKTKLIFTLLFTILFITVGYYGKIKDRFIAEFDSNTRQTYNYIQSGNSSGIVYDVSMKDAWTNEKFRINDHLTGTSFRIYQVRIFFEMLSEDNIFFTGYGFNASQDKIREKGKEHNLFSGNDKNIGYQEMNFHNMYIQAFAEMGIIGLTLILLLAALNLKNALKNKYFVHIAFAVLMITLFLTESFLWRQRGIVLFITLYCMFNAMTAPKKEYQL